MTLDEFRSSFSNSAFLESGVFKNYSMKLSFFFKSKVFDKNYKKVLLKEVGCLANIYKKWQFEL